MPTVTNADATLYYECYGESTAGNSTDDTVVLAHGAGGNAASWWQQVPFFVERGYRVIAFDHRGFARSSCPKAALQIEHFPADLLAILDAEGIARAALVCQSMGGWTGLPAARAHPERVRALVLCGTPGGVWTDAVRDALSGIGSRLQESGGLTGPGGAALGQSFKARAPALALLYDQISKFNRSDLAPMLKQIGAMRVPPVELAGYATPTLLVAGHEDVLFPLDAIRSVAASIPGAELSELEGAGHSVYFEEPAHFNALVADFLSKHP